MPPKKAMKKAMKSVKPSPCQKDKGPKKVMKSILKARNLQRLGKLTLAEKVAKAAEGTDTPEEAAQELKGMLSKQEHSRVWSKYNTHLKGKPKKEQKEFQKASKAEKGMLAAMHFVKAHVPKFLHCNEYVDASSSLQQKEKWLSEAQMIENHGEKEFWAHVQSGRISWRSDPWTEGVYNYKDNGNITKVHNVRKGKEYKAGQEFTANEEEESAWGRFYNQDPHWHLNDFESKGKGKSLTKGSWPKGKGKGKDKGPLAIKDGLVDDDEEEDDDSTKNKKEKTIAEEWKETLTKAKRARDQSTSHMADCQAALELAEKAKRLTKTGKAESEELLKGMSKKTNVLKDLLAKKDKWGSLAKAKALLVEAASEMKKVKEEAKELNQLANKTSSKASKK